MSTCILVLGTPRSGTSAVAGVLHHLGVPMGERLMPPDEWNPAGFFQDADFEALVEEYDYFWDRTQRLNTPDFEAIIIAKISELIAMRNQLPLWGLKSNRMVHFIDDLASQTSLKVIRTTRPRAASIASWRARSGNSLAEATRVIDYINSLIDAALTRLAIEPLTVDFRSIIADPQTAIDRIANFVGVPTTDAAFQWVQPSLVRFD